MIEEDEVLTDPVVNLAPELQSPPRIIRFLTSLPIFGFVYFRAYRYGSQTAAKKKYGEEFNTTHSGASHNLGIKYGNLAFGFAFCLSVATILAAPIILLKYSVATAVAYGIPATAGLTTIISTNFYAATTALLGLGFLSLNVIAYALKKCCGRSESPSSSKSSPPTSPLSTVSDEARDNFGSSPAHKLPVYPESSTSNNRVTRRLNADGTFEGYNTILRGMVAPARDSISSNHPSASATNVAGDEASDDDILRVTEDDLVVGGPQHSPAQSPRQGKH